MVAEVNILLTGSSGFLASHLKPLIKRHKVIEMDIEHGIDIFDYKFENYFRNSDVVIHLAALTNVEDSKINPKPYYMVNTLGTARVVYLCMKYNKKLIYPSTLHVFNPEASPYANSKTGAETIVRMAMQFIPVVILRLFNVFGKGMNNNSGSIINLFLTSDKIEVYGNGNVTRDFIHVKDVVRIIRDAIKPKWNGNIVQVGTGKRTSTKYLAHLFSKYRGVDIKFSLDKPQVKWPIAKTKLLRKLYGKPLKTNLEKDIKALCQN